MRCGDFLDFLVYTDHLEFTLSRTQPQGPSEVLLMPNSQGLQDKSTSSSEEMVSTVNILHGTIRILESHLNMN